MWTNHLFVLYKKKRNSILIQNVRSSSTSRLCCDELQVFWTLTGCRCKVFDFSCEMGQSFCPLVAIQQYYDVLRWHTKPGAFTCLLYNTAVVLIQNTVRPCLNYRITLSSCTCPSDRLSIVGSVFKNVAWQSWGLNHSSTADLNQTIPGGPATEQYQHLYLTSQVAVSLCIFSEVDEVLPLGPVSCVQSRIRGRICCAW